MLTRAYIPEAQPRLKQRHVTVKMANTQYDKPLLDTLADQEERFARIETPLDRDEIIAIRDDLRTAARRLTKDKPDLVTYDGDELKVDLVVTDEDDNEVARGGARGAVKWMDKIPAEGKYRLWFRMHQPRDTGARAYMKYGGDGLLGRTGAGSLGGPALVLSWPVLDPEHDGVSQVDADGGDGQQRGLRPEEIVRRPRGERPVLLGN